MPDTRTTDDLINMKNENKLLIFGLMSTLVDSGPRYVTALSRVCEQFGIEAPQPQFVMDMLGEKTLPEIVAALPDPVQDNQIIDFMAACNRTCDSMLMDKSWTEALFPQAEDTLTYLRNEGHQLGLFSGVREEAVYNQLNHHGITPLFNADYIRGKHSERDAHLNSKQLKTQQIASIIETYKANGQGTVDENHVFVIGDSEADFRAAQNMNVGFLGFAPTSEKKQALMKLGVDYVFDNYDQLSMLIANYSDLNHAPRPETANPDDSTGLSVETGLMQQSVSDAEALTIIRKGGGRKIPIQILDSKPH